MNYFIPTLAFIYFVWILLILPNMYGTKVYSPYNQINEKSNEDVEKHKNNLRKDSAIEYIRNMNQKESLKFYADLIETNKVEHLFLAISEGKKENKYQLTQLLTQLDREFHSLKSRDALLVCDRSAKSNVLEIESVSKYFLVLQPNTTEDKFVWKNLQEEKKKNFLNCLTEALKRTTPEYVTVLWDVVVPHTNFISYLKFIINNKIESRLVRGELKKNDDSWLFLHLLEPIHRRRFNLSGESFRELVCVAILGAILFYYIANAKTNYNNSSRVAVTIYGSIVFVTLAISLGRPYLTELRWILPDLIRIEQFYEVIPVTCVTLPYKSVIKMSSYLATIRCSPYLTFHKVWDQAIGTFETPAFFASPSLVRYVNS